MIQTEQIIIDGRALIRTYSDTLHRIIQNGTGITYDEAIDPAEMGRTYMESDDMIEDELTDSEALRMLLGGERFETVSGD